MNVNIDTQKEQCTFDICLIGARGFVGKELVSLIDEHPHFNLTAVCSRNQHGKLLEDYSKPLYYQQSSPQTVASIGSDAYILALPNGYAAQYVKVIEQHNPNAIIIDLSADYRFDKKWQYSQPETSSPQKLTRISNPGCYASAIQLAIAPLRGIIAGPVHCFGISGYSGAGTKPSDKNNLHTLKSNTIPYALSGHIHEKESAQAMDAELYFSPTVAQYFRGISMTVHSPLLEASNTNKIQQIFNHYYRNCPLIKIQPDIPLVSEVANRHQAIIGGFDLSSDGTHLALNLVLDNLLKGAATQAIQNLNMAFSLDNLSGINYD